MCTLTLTAPIAYDALPKPKTESEYIALMDAMLAELSEAEARTAISSERSKEVWRRIDALHDEMQVILSNL